MRSKVLSVAAAALLTTLTAWRAEASVDISLSRPELVSVSDMVVHGTVESQVYDISPDGSLIYTRTTLRVHQYAKGDGPDKVVVEQLGGVWGDLQSRIVGDPQLQLGQELVLFLRAGDAGVTYLAAGAQGAYQVTGQNVTRDLSEVSLVVQTGQGLTVIDPVPEPAGETLSSLLSDVVSFRVSR